MRRRTLALPFALLAGLTLASSVVAGGWATVAVTDVPGDPPAGGGTTIELEVLQHGETAVSWPTLAVIATNDSTGASFRTPAEADGSPGRYVATLTFPAEGDWTLTFDSNDLIMEGSSTLHVAVAVAQQAPATAPLAPTAPTVEPVAVALVVIALIAAVTVGAIAIRGRRPTSHDERASVSG